MFKLISRSHVQSEDWIVELARPRLLSASRRDTLKYRMQLAVSTDAASLACLIYLGANVSTHYMETITNK